MPIGDHLPRSLSSRSRPSLVLTLSTFDSARIADAIVEAVQSMERRFSAMCATMEQQQYQSLNPTRFS